MSKTRRHISLVFAGNIVNLVIGFFINAYVARYIAIEEYGVYGTVNAALILIPSILDIGLSVALIKYSTNNDDSDNIVFNSVLVFKCIISILLIPLVIVYATSLSEIILLSSQHSALITMLFVGATASNITSSFQAFAQVRSEFRCNVVLGIIPTALRFLVVLLLINLNEFTLYNLIVVTCLAPLFGALSGFILYRKETKIRISFPIIRNMIGFSKWIAITTICSAVMQRIDIFLINKLSTPKDVGYYFAALQLAFVIPIVTTSVTNVVLPQVVSYSSNTSQKLYVKKILAFTPYIIAAFLVLTISSKYIFALVFGDKFIPASTPFIIISAVYLLGIIVTPLGLLLYSLNKPQLQTLLLSVQILVLFIVDFMLIPRYGVTGAACGVLIAKLTGAVMTVYWILRYIYRQTSRNLSVNNTSELA